MDFCFELLCCVYVGALQILRKKKKLNCIVWSWALWNMNEGASLWLCPYGEVFRRKCLYVCDPEISRGNIHIFLNLLPSWADLPSRNLKVAKLLRSDPQLSEAPRGRSGCRTGRSGWRASPYEACLISFSLWISNVKMWHLWNVYDFDMCRTWCYEINYEHYTGNVCYIFLNNVLLCQGFFNYLLRPTHKALGEKWDTD